MNGYLRVRATIILAAGIAMGATAGHGKTIKLVRDLEPAEWEEIIRVNLTGT
jgi:NAD(P)-dependent dehydrogenase (short-subunit alcohol dehydrogenase family)